MGKHSVLMWNNRKSQRTILPALGCALSEMPINQDQEVLTKFYSMYAKNFKELERTQDCQEVATPQQREDWTHHLHGAVVTDTEESDSDYEDSVMTLLIYPEEYKNQ